jgi:hypothetical protein
MSKWDSELTEEKLKDQIKAAKEKWKEQKIKLEEVYYEDECLYCIISGNRGGKLLWFNKREFKCLKGVSDRDIAKVILLGDRAIQWKELDIIIGFDKLFEGIQLQEDWAKSISE